MVNMDDYRWKEKGTTIYVDPSTNWREIEDKVNYRTIQGVLYLLMAPGVYTDGPNFTHFVGDIVIKRDPAYDKEEPIVIHTNKIYKEKFEEDEEKEYNAFFTFDRCYRVFIDEIRFEFIDELEYLLYAKYTDVQLTKVQMNSDILVKYGQNIIVVDSKRNEGFKHELADTEQRPTIKIEGLCKIFFDEKSKDFTCEMKGACEGYNYGSNIAFVNMNTKAETHYTTNLIESSSYDKENNEYTITEAISKGEGFIIGKEDMTKLFELIGKVPEK